MGRRGQILDVKFVIFFEFFFSIYLLEDLVFRFFEALQIAFKFVRRESFFEFPPKTPLFSRFFS